jgi:hypothetical protein
MFVPIPGVPFQEVFGHAPDLLRVTLIGDVVPFEDAARVRTPSPAPSFRLNGVEGRVSLLNRLIPNDFTSLTSSRPALAFCAGSSCAVTGPSQTSNFELHSVD